MNTEIIISQATRAFENLSSAAERDYSNSHNLITIPSINRFSELFFHLFIIIDKMKDYNLINDNDYLLLDDIRRCYQNPISIILYDKASKVRKEKNEEIKEDLCQDISNQLNTIVNKIKSHLTVLTH